jgi:hypothetical protein
VQSCSIRKPELIESGRSKSCAAVGHAALGLRGLRLWIEEGRPWRRSLGLTDRGGADRGECLMIGSATGTALPNSSELESFSSAPISNASSSKSGLNLATEAQMRNATNEKKQSAPYSSKTSVVIPYLASPATPNR